MVRPSNNDLTLTTDLYKYNLYTVKCITSLLYRTSRISTCTYNTYYKTIYPIYSSGGSRNFEKGVRPKKGDERGPAPERRGGDGEGGPAPQSSRILGLKSWVLLSFDGKFRAKRGGGEDPLGPSKSATVQ
jgi:hypothetical protein